MIPVLLNELMVENKETSPLIIFDSILMDLNNNVKLQIYTQSIKLIAQILQDDKKIDWQPRYRFTETARNFPVFDHIKNGNPHRRAVIGLEDYVLTLKFMDIYREVKKYIDKKFPQSNISILDCACGSGYGSVILGNSSLVSVTGVDMDKEAIEYATLLNFKNNVNYLQNTLEEFSLNKQGCKYNAVVSIETIEHVEDAEGFLFQLLDVLDEDGLLAYPCLMPGFMALNITQIMLPIGH
nr:methyltransferase domain-containing protein [Desulforamulus aquiferis]